VRFARDVLTSERHEPILLGDALAGLIAGFDLDFALPGSEIPHAIRRRLNCALGSPALFLDVARRTCGQLVHDPLARSLFDDPRSRYTVQVFCWPVGFGNQPHLHDNWNVSAVLVGSMLVFRSPTSEAACLASEPLVASAGTAGVVMPPQFHCLRNVGASSAITLHVFSADAGSDELADAEMRPTIAERFDDADLLAIVAEAAQHGGALAEDVVRTAFTAAAGSAAKLEVTKRMAMLDPAAAVPMGRSLAALVGGRDGQRLNAVVDRLQAASEAGHRSDRA
jgi:hypothetical protein